MEWTAKEISPIIVATVGAVIGALGTIAVAVINRRKNPTEDKPAPSSPLVVINTSFREASAAIRATSTIVPATPAKLSRQSFVEISHREIAEKLRGVTPFQQGIIEKSYVGLRVRWRVLLKSLDEIRPGDGLLHGRTADTKSVISCSGAMADIAHVIHADTDEEIDVEGTITLVSSAYIELKDSKTARLKTVSSLAPVD